MGKRPGFRRERPVYKLTFEDPDLDGLEVTAKSLPLGEFLDLQRLQAEAESDPGAAEKLIRHLAEVLTSWNLEDDNGDPVPCTYDGLAQHDMPFVITIFLAWMQAVASVPNPSPGISKGGGISPELSLPMELP